MLRVAQKEQQNKKNQKTKKCQTDGYDTRAEQSPQGSVYASSSNDARGW